jgi:hypothetical protein
MKTDYRSKTSFQMHYGYLAKWDSWCDVDVYSGGDKPALVIFTEVADNPGTSITNAIETIAAMVVKDYDLDPVATIFIEHYTYDPETFDKVEMPWTGDSYDNPKWTSIGIADVKAMKGFYK